MPQEAVVTETHFERDTEMVVNDVMQGYVSIESAKNDYGSSN